MSPFYTILSNAGYLDVGHLSNVGAIEVNKLLRWWINLMDVDYDINIDLPEGVGINAINGEVVNMVDEKIIDPLIVIKTSLINAVSVASTIISANCVVSNLRLEE